MNQLQIVGRSTIFGNFTLKVLFLDLSIVPTISLIYIFTSESFLHFCSISLYRIESGTEYSHHVKLRLKIFKIRTVLTVDQTLLYLFSLFTFIYTSIILIQLKNINSLTLEVSQGKYLLIVDQDIKLFLKLHPICLLIQSTPLIISFYSILIITL